MIETTFHPIRYILISYSPLQSPTLREKSENDKTRRENVSETEETLQIEEEQSFARSMRGNRGVLRSKSICSSFHLLCLILDNIRDCTLSLPNNRYFHPRRAQNDWILLTWLWVNEILMDDLSSILPT